MSNKPKFQTIRINGRRYKVFGMPKDRYFRGLLRGTPRSDFLLYITKHTIPKNAVIFDVGANIGQTSVILSANATAGKVYSFEPSPTAFPLLEATIDANDLDNCSAFQLALGAQEGEIAFFDNPESASASHLAPTDRSLGDSNSLVSVTTIDKFVHDKVIDRLDFIKIDVEGFDLDVIKGGMDTISQSRCKVFTEFNSFTLIAFGNQNPRHVLETLLEQFPYVYRFENSKACLIRDEASALTFIHDNIMRNGSVDDLFCSYSALS